MGSHRRPSTVRPSGAGPPAGRKRSFAVVVPARNETTQLPGCLDTVARERPDEVVVVDGRSEDGTREVARARGARTLTADRARRSTQMNLGAASCTSEVLVFLCADSRLPAGALSVVDRAFDRHPDLVAGSFALRLHDDADIAALPNGLVRRRRQVGRRLSLRAMATSADVYCRCTRTLMCDRGIFVLRDAFERLGGFRELPVMEDVDLGRRLRQESRVIVLRRPAVSSSGRRFGGPAGALLAARVLVACAATALGMPAERVARALYAPHGGPAGSGSSPPTTGRSREPAHERESSSRAAPAVRGTSRHREDG